MIEDPEELLIEGIMPPMVEEYAEEQCGNAYRTLARIYGMRGSDPSRVELFKAAVKYLAQVCWWSQKTPVVVLRRVWARRKEDTESNVVMPKELIVDCEKAAQWLMDHPDSANGNVVSEIQAELGILARACRMATTPETLAEVVRSCAKEAHVGLDILHLLACGRGLDWEASQLLPMAVWIRRVNPERDLWIKRTGKFLLGRGGAR